METTENPLKQYFRQPAIYLRLPSNGLGWPNGSIEMTQNRELPVYPMTAIDEITYRTPDALYNGEAVISVIKSCVPNIINPWYCPVVDLDAILVAIRIASYGHSMDIGTKCPSCEDENEFGLDLRTVMDNLKSADYSKSLTIGDLEFFMRPLNYKEVTDNSQTQFEQQKTAQMLAQSEGTENAEEIRARTLNDMMKKIVEVTVSALAHSISEIRIGGTTSVTEPAHIEEFLREADRNVFNRVKERVLELRQESELQPLRIKCPGCENEYTQEFTLDMSRFFASAS